MRHGVTRDERPFAPLPDCGRKAAMGRAKAVATMAMSGVVAARVTRAVGELLAAWREEGIGLSDRRWRVEAFQREIESALPLVEDYVNDAEAGEAKAHAVRQFAAIKAMAAAVDAELAGIRCLV